MNIENLSKNHFKLLLFMENSGYSKNYISKVRGEIKYILRESAGQNWNNYADVYLTHKKQINSSSSLHTKRVILGIIEHFDVKQQYPNRTIQHPLLRYGKYHLLNDEFKAVIDCYYHTERLRGIKESTLYGNSSNASNFLFELQAKGFFSVQAITEKAVLSIFLSTDGNLRRCYGYKKNIAAVFKACVPKNPEVFSQILAFLPSVKNSRKNPKYLLQEEAKLIKQALCDADTPLSLRDKAIGILSLYTGLRSCDIVGLNKSSIDWEREIIQINQQKTGEPLELPLLATVGNAIYDYITTERPLTDCDFIFITHCKPYRRLKADTLTGISNKIMEAAGIRNDKDKRSGFRIFRHYLATNLLGNHVSLPVISRILGHTSPASLNPYLSADFEHLKECALSIDQFPISREVFVNA